VIRKAPAIMSWDCVRNMRPPTSQRPSFSALFATHLENKSSRNLGVNWSSHNQLQNLDRVGRHPDVNLLESRLQPVLEFEEEPTMFGLVRDVYEDPYQVIAVRPSS
jgi:hypothetical protein